MLTFSHAWEQFWPDALPDHIPMTRYGRQQDFFSNPQSSSVEKL